MNSFVFDEGTANPFVREPFIVRLGIIGSNFDFFVSNIHTSPSVATPEIYGMFFFWTILHGWLTLLGIIALIDVVAFLNQTDEDIILLGDFNGTFFPFLSLMASLIFPFLKNNLQLMEATSIQLLDGHPCFQTSLEIGKTSLLMIWTPLCLPTMPMSMTGCWFHLLSPSITRVALPMSLYFMILHRYAQQKVFI